MADSSAEVKASAAASFAALARDLQHAGATGLRRELYKGMSRAGRPLKPAVVKSAQEKLPSSGGRGRRRTRLVRTGETLTNAASGRTHEIRAKQVLREKSGAAKLTDPKADSVAARVAGATFTPRLSTSRAGVGLRFTATEKRGKKVDVASLDRGRLRHMTFGRRTTKSGKSLWFDQPVPPGWFTTPLEGQAGNVERELTASVDAVTDQINRA